MPCVDKDKERDYQQAYGKRKRAEHPPLPRGNARSVAPRTFNISHRQMERLWTVYHSLALSVEISPYVEVSAVKLKEILFGIRFSDQANPRRHIPDETDWKALR
jgi:hypothetical protein